MTQPKNKTNMSRKLFVIVKASCPCILIGFRIRVNSFYCWFHGKVILIHGATSGAWGNLGCSRQLARSKNFGSFVEGTAGPRAKVGPGWVVRPPVCLFPAPRHQRGTEKSLSKTSKVLKELTQGALIGEGLACSGLRGIFPAHMNVIMIPCLDMLPLFCTHWIVHRIREP